MARLEPIPFHDWDENLKKVVRSGDTASFYEENTIGVMARAPEALLAMFGMQGSWAKTTTLPRRLREVVRLRVAFHNQCRSCMAIRYQSAVDDGLTEGVVCSLEKPEEARDLTPQEKAAIAYADQQSLNHFSVNDETFAELRKHFTERQIIELGLHVASCIGFGRFAATLHMVESLPDSYKADDGEKRAPWRDGQMVVPG